MSLKKLQQRLLLETANAAAEHRRAVTELESRGHRGLGLGDLFLFADRGDRVFEWAIIAAGGTSPALAAASWNPSDSPSSEAGPACLRAEGLHTTESSASFMDLQAAPAACDPTGKTPSSATREPHWVVVPADDHPMIGSRDVPTRPNRVGGLVLRCGIWAELSSVAFDLRRRTGVLAPEVVRLAQRKRFAIETGEILGSPLSREIDALSEYRRWLDELVSAREHLISLY